MSASAKDSIEFTDAHRTASRLNIGIAGPSGSGKTFSALRVATGLTGGEDIFVIDSENGRALQYADRFKFRHGLLQPPFSPLRYLAAMQKAVNAGAKAIVVDSMTHEHEGEGGLLDMHEAVLTRMAGQDQEKRERMKFTAWIEPKAQHGQLVRFIQRMPCHGIFCFRAKDKLELRKNARGKMEPVRIGWTPICTERLDYEMTMTVILPPRSKGLPDLGEASTKLDDLSFGFVAGQLTEDIGGKLARWATGAPLIANDTTRKAGRVIEHEADPKGEADPEAATVDNTRPTKDRVLTGARSMLTALRGITTTASYNAFMVEGEAKLAWLEANRKPTWDVLEAARVDAFERANARSTEGAGA